jgi:hypothetical protein
MLSLNKMISNKKETAGLLFGKNIICDEIHYCNNLFSKGFGLMFRKENSVANTAWVFYFKNPRRISLTMIFVFFTIDAIFLDNERKIVEMTTLKPWSFYSPAKKSNYCIELRQGTIHNFKLKIGDKLRF